MADAISILTQIKKGPFALRRFFWFRADPPIAYIKRGQSDISDVYFDDISVEKKSKSPSTPREAQNCFFSSSSSSSSSLFFSLLSSSHRHKRRVFATTC